MREFSSGATRDSDEDKPDFLGYMSPLVVQAYNAYMLKHQKQADGTMRGADNWKQGMPKEVYRASLGRHFLDMWLETDGYGSRDGLREALCAIIFNASGMLYEELREEEAIVPLAHGVYHGCHSCKYDGLSVEACVAFNCVHAVCNGVERWEHR
jgi:hypothetical protein